jgi:uncharacterized damage-inducible protein DinB
MSELQAFERNRLYGSDSHVHLLSALEGVDIETVGRRIDGFPHSIFQIVDHMVFWQDVALARIEGRPYDAGECAADGWCHCAEPESAEEWARRVERLAEGVRALEGHLAQIGEDDAAIREIRMVEGHNSYHLGQIVLMRRILGSWPPPKGGDTW